jgi:hypothetical protein
MELSLAVNASLVALSKFGQYMPVSRICSAEADDDHPISSHFLYRAFPYSVCGSGRCLLLRQDRHYYSRESRSGGCCRRRVRHDWIYLFDLGLTMHYSASDRYKLIDVKEASRETTLCLASAHALVRLDDGTIVGDPMEKTTLDALNWQLSKGPSFRLYTARCSIYTPVSRRCRHVLRAFDPAPHFAHDPAPLPVQLRAQAHVDRLRPAQWAACRCCEGCTGDDQGHARQRSRVLRRDVQVLYPSWKSCPRARIQGDGESVGRKGWSEECLVNVGADGI